ncbi:MAG: hypothetical protein JO159_11555 [Acidobacteria bacterium]|nr:hypothetical protein [Acidobacteriota bacterium]
MPSLQERVTALELSAAQHDRQIKAIRALIQEGTRLMVETRKDLRALATNVDNLVNGLRRGSNGHSRRKTDLQ